MLSQVLREVLAFDLQAMTGFGLVSPFDHRRQRGVQVEVAHAERVGRGDDGIGGVAVHLGGVAIGDRPLRQPAVLLRVVHEGLDHVRRSDLAPRSTATRSRSGRCPIRRSSSTGAARSSGSDGRPPCNRRRSRSRCSDSAVSGRGRCRRSVAPIGCRPRYGSVRGCGSTAGWPQTRPSAETNPGLRPRGCSLPRRRSRRRCLTLSSTVRSVDVSNVT